MPAGPGDELATGGTITYVGDLVRHTFTAGDTFTPSQDLTAVDIIVVGAGGGGGSLGGGGGAGAVEVTTVDLTEAVGYPVVIGAGGAHSTNIAGPSGNGTSSTFAGTTALGGGGGGSTNAKDSNAGGSSGGTGGNAGAAGVLGAAIGSNTNLGGNGQNGTPYRPGGGGGSSSAGADGSVSGNGGSGYDASAFGLGTIAGGGGAGGFSGNPGGLGTDGGGNGGSNTAGTAATTYGSGGGGGGGYYSSPASFSNGTDGAAGIVVVQYDPTLMAPPAPVYSVPSSTPLTLDPPRTVVSADVEPVWLYNLAGEQLAPLVDIDDLTIEDRLGELSLLKLTLRADDPRAGLIVPDVMLRWSDRYYRVAELDQQQSNRGAFVTVIAEALWIDLAHRVKALGNFPLLGLLAQAGLVSILTGTGWTAGDDPDPGDVTLYSTEGYDDTVLTHLRRWAELTGYELAFDTDARTVSLVEQVGLDRGVGFRYGSNVTKIRRRYEPPTATVLYPLGANGLDITTTNPSGEAYVENFGWYTDQGLTIGQARTLHTRELIQLDEAILLPVNLYDRAVETLAELSQPTISYEADVVDLSDAVGASLEFDVGDTVSVYDETFSVDINTRVVRRIYRPLTPGGDEVELSYLRTTSSTVSASRQPDYGSVSILVDQCVASVVSSGALDYAEISFNSTGTATAVTGSTFVGVATGSGTCRFSMIVDGNPAGVDVDVKFDAAVDTVVEFSAPSYAADLAAEGHLIVFRAQVVVGAGTIAVAAGGGRGWILTTGAFGLGVNTSPNRRVSEEMLDLAITFSTVDSYLVELNGPTPTANPLRLVVDGEVETLITLGTLTDRYVLPFTIGDPLFGAIDGPGVIPS